MIYALLVITIVIMVAIIASLMFLNASKEKRYEEDIQFIEMCIKNWIVNDNNYRIITEMFEALWRNNQNPERTAKAYSRFKRKYKEFTPYILAESIYQN